METNYILYNIITYSEQAYIIMRAGNTNRLHCKPNNQICIDINSYDTCELIFAKAYSESTIADCLINNINLLKNINTLSYKEFVKLLEPSYDVFDLYQYSVGFDGCLIIPHADKGLIQIFRESFVVRDKRFEAKKITGLTVEKQFEDKVIDNKSVPTPKCRSCGDYDPYGFVEPDKVIDDGLYTCWQCAHHPFRWFKNVPEESKTSFMTFYKVFY